MKFSWIDVYGTDKKDFTIYAADSELIGCIRSNMIDEARRAFEHDNFARARELLDNIEEIDSVVKQAAAAAREKEATNG